MNERGTSWGAWLGCALLLTVVWPSALTGQGLGPVADLSGSWVFETTPGSGIQIVGGGGATLQFTMVLIQRGDTITGTHIRQGDQTTRAVEGSIQGSSFQIGYLNTQMATDGGTPTGGVPVTFSGTMETPDRLVGTQRINGAPLGTFTARRVPGPEPRP